MYLYSSVYIIFIVSNAILMSVSLFIYMNSINPILCACVWTAVSFYDYMNTSVPFCVNVNSISPILCECICKIFRVYRYTYPELVKYTIESLAGIVLTNFSASRTMLSCRNRELVFRICICSAPALTTLGWQWPTGCNIYKCILGNQ